MREARRFRPEARKEVTRTARNGTPRIWQVPSTTLFTVMASARKPSRSPRKTGVAFDALIARIADPETAFDAMREAERLHDAEQAPELIRRSRESPGWKERDAIYFVLGCLGKNTESAAISRALTEALETEKNAIVRDGLLDAIEKQSRVICSKKLVTLAQSGNQSAIGAIARCPRSQASRVLLALVSGVREPYALCEVLNALLVIREKRALLRIVELARGSGRGAGAVSVRETALAVLVELGNHSHRAVFLEAADSRDENIRRLGTIGARRHHLARKSTKVD